MGETGGETAELVGKMRKSPEKKPIQGRLKNKGNVVIPPAQKRIKPPDIQTTPPKKEIGPDEIPKLGRRLRQLQEAIRKATAGGYNDQADALRKQYDELTGKKPS